MKRTRSAKRVDRLREKERIRSRSSQRVERLGQKRPSHPRSTRRVERAFWAGGFLCLIGAITALYLDISPTPIVTAGVIGLQFWLVPIVMEIRRDGFCADSIAMLAGYLALSLAAVGYFFHHHDWALLTALGGFLFFAFASFLISFGAQTAALWGVIKDLWRRWQG